MFSGILPEVHIFKFFYVVAVLNEDNQLDICFSCPDQFSSESLVLLCYVSGKLLKIRDAGFGDVIKTSCYGDELYFYFRVDDESFERQFTKKMDLHEEVDKVCKKLEDIKKVVDLLS